MERNQSFVATSVENALKELTRLCLGPGFHRTVEDQLRDLDHDPERVIVVDLEHDADLELPLVRQLRVVRP